MKTNHRKIFGTGQRAQRGVTLVVAVVILASVAFISFALSALILREISAARLLLRTEPAISGADAGGEVGLYNLFRLTGNVAQSGTFSQSGVSYKVVSQLYDSPYVFSIPAGSVLTVALYDAANPDNPNANYGTAVFVNDPSSDILKVDVTPIGGTDPICSQTLGSGQTSAACLLNNPGDDRYQLVLTPMAGGAATGQIQTTDESGNAKGVPSTSPKLQVTGTNINAQRKIQIDLNPPGP